MELYDVLDQIDQVIYLSDLDTCEVIFVNRCGKKQYGPVTPGVKCYEYLQGADAPCAFCTNQRLREDPDHRYTWHRKLPGIGHLLLHDSIVTVNGRPCRMELAVNVTRYAHIFEAELSLATEQKLVECIDKLVLSDDFDAAMDQVLEIIRQQYQAARAYVFRIDWDKGTATNTYEVCAPGVTSEIQNLQAVPLETMREWLEVLKNRKGKLMTIHSIEALKEIPGRQEEYACLAAQGIQAVAEVPIFCGDKLYGFLGVDDPQGGMESTELLTHIAYFISDEVQKRELHARLLANSYTDTLTGLPNRLSYDETIDSLQGRELPTGVGYLDINGLKWVNDHLGHAYGNQVILKACQVMCRFFPKKQIYRVSGDEFVMICPDMGYRPFWSACRAMEKELKNSQEGLATFGYAWGSETEDLNELLHKAEQVMYAQRRKYAMRGDSSPRRPGRPEYLDGLLREFRQSKFVVYLQPLYGVEQGAVIGAEALVRRIGEDGSVCAPFEFVHMMEEENLISVVDYEMLEQSCRLLRDVGQRWPGFQLACNMSRNTLAELDYLDRIDDILTRTGVDHSQLIFEVTESSRGLQLESIEDRLNALKARGIAVAVDDMGTECSCLEMLYLPQLDLVKIDRSLISKANHGPREQAVIGSLIDLCHKLGLGCVAEGIETKEQGQLLKSLGCDRLQGYYFGRPMPPEAFFARFGPGVQEHRI